MTLDSVSHMEKIVHMDELSTKNFLLFVDNFIKDSTDTIEVSEKIDGQNFSFGRGLDGELYTKTKRSLPIKSSSEYADFFFMQGLREYHDILECNSSLLSEIYDFIKFKLDISGEFNFQVFCEIMPNSQTNIVQYASNKSIVVFDVLLGGNSILELPTSDDILEFIACTLHDVGGWVVVVKNKVDISGFEINTKPIDDLRKLSSDNVTLLGSRKRATQQLKTEVTTQIQTIKDNIKLQFINYFVKGTVSHIGNGEPEGVIVRDFANNLVVKIVDKDSFSEINKVASENSSKVTRAITSAKSRIKKNIFFGADILKNFTKIIEKLNDYLFINKGTGNPRTFRYVHEVFDVIYNDMNTEGRIQLPCDEVKEIVTRELLALHEVILHETQLLERNKESIPMSKYIISSEKINASASFIKTIQDALSEVDDADLLPIYYSVIHFVIGNSKLHEIKNIYNIQ